MTPYDTVPASRFDPFHNRLCRDIRNDLSVGFIASIRQKDPGLIAAEVNRYHAADIEPFMAAYIDGRFKKYQRVNSAIAASRLAIEDTYPIACLMWNQSLFFEFHEWLEHTWHNAGEPERQMIQALIRSAGVYLLLEAGRKKGAKKMAFKALAGLNEHRSLIPKFFEVDCLIDKLSAVDPVPPEFSCS